MKKAHKQSGINILGGVLAVLLLTGIPLLGLAYHEIQAKLADARVRSFVQAQASRILGSDVQIGRIRYRPPFQIALSEFEIKPSQTRPSALLEVDQLILGYGLFNLFRRDFRMPTQIGLDRPRVYLRGGGSSLPLLGASISSEKLPTELFIRRGELHYPVGGAGQELILTDLRVKAKPDAWGQIRLSLTSKLSGMAKGEIEMKGTTDPSFNHYEFQVELKGVSFEPQSGMPLRKLRGKLLVTDQVIEAVGLNGFFHDWEIVWKGRVDHWQSRPQISFQITNARGKRPFRLSFRADLESQNLEGEWFWLGRSYPFNGKVLREGGKILFPELSLPHGYRGKAEFDGSNGNYEIFFGRDRRRIQIQSNANRLEFQTRFQLDHISINHLDCVLSGTARLTPLSPPGHGRGPRFKAEVQTDYFILEYEPIEDFRGSFELNSDGLEAIDFRWGQGFLLGGRILFKGRDSREDLLLRVQGFPLKSVKGFAGRPVPQNLDGILEGKLKLQGDLKRPETLGYFTIKDGSLEHLNFDRAIVQFRGFSPFLRLYDSKIYKGRSTLKLIGAIDLSLPNFFHGIQIQRPDHLVIWKGISAYWKEGESAIGAEKPLKGKLSMGMEVGAGISNSKPRDGEEEHAMLGPKVRF